MGEVKKMSAELIFEFKNKKTGKILGKGMQRVAFANSQGKLIPMPDDLSFSLQRMLKTPAK